MIQTAERGFKAVVSMRKREKDRQNSGGKGKTVHDMGVSIALERSADSDLLSSMQLFYMTLPQFDAIDAGAIAAQIRYLPFSVVQEKLAVFTTDLRVHHSQL